MSSRSLTGLRRVGPRALTWTASHGWTYLLDAASWICAISLAVLLRLDFDPTVVRWPWVLAFSSLAILLQGVFGFIGHLYRGRYTYGTFHEAKSLMAVVVIVTFVLVVVSLLMQYKTGIPRSTSFIALPFAFVMMGGTRYYRRTIYERGVRPDDQAENALVYGAGFLGEGLVKRMIRDPQSPYRPVGVIDDDPRKQNLHLYNIPVRGTGADLISIANSTGAQVVVLCIGKADAEFIRGVSDRADAAGLRLLVLPVLTEILEKKVQLTDLRAVAIEDLIGRHPVDTKIEDVGGYISGRRVLVTGAGGSIGSELCRQLIRFAPEEVIMLDRDESGLHGVQMSIMGSGLLDTDDVVLADIRDQDALQAIFTARRPDVVFHAAALKHLPMLEQYPSEAWQTNVLGTLNVLNAALDAGVETFINISTDKAADPTSVLGHSKRVAERLTAWAADTSNHTYLSVRFGNVLGSRGSMLPTFMAQIEGGGPLTVTHPDVTRYFMTIPEACQLVIQAGYIGSGGEVLILDMGDPVRILDVAERMIDRSGRDIEIVFTGLRTGEKLHEDLIAHEETDSRPLHPQITHTQVPPLVPEKLDIEEWLRRMVRAESDESTVVQIENAIEVSQ
ncbi:polysaccharide biosynthesis protein [Arthrobacter sp. MMS24-S77]